jgi:ribonuclease P protein component
VRGENLVLNIIEGREASRLGIALTRRMIPLAADRSRVKRLVREVFRRHEVKGRGLDCVVALRRRFEAQSAAALRAELASLFDKVISR